MIVPVEEIVICELELSVKRLRNTWAELVVIDEADDVFTMLNVNVGPVTPLIVEVPVLPVRHPVHVPLIVRLLNAPLPVEVPRVVDVVFGKT